ncbi:Mss4-like protein [Exophiala viscosa]|uniref:Mss4-like protein n=1 Tax=Exophiala viscosa TaxID=2486360 RepID=UPI00219F2C51|nr:Mss4-like protein [Exophiala viscosa]
MHSDFRTNLTLRHSRYIWFLSHPTMQGHCNCGSVTVEVNVPPNNEHKGFVCHCRNCQKSSGAGGAYLLMLPLSDITFNGPIKHYLDTNTNSGRAVHRHFCETCGS